MAKTTIWVLIETDEDNFGNPAKPDNAEIRDIFRRGDSYGIVDMVPETDIEDIVLKADK